MASSRRAAPARPAGSPRGWHGARAAAGGRQSPGRPCTSPASFLSPHCSGLTAHLHPRPLLTPKLSQVGTPDPLGKWPCLLWTLLGGRHKAMDWVIPMSIQPQDLLPTTDLLISQRCPGRMYFGEVPAPGFPGFLSKEAGIQWGKGRCAIPEQRGSDEPLPHSWS